LTKLATDGQARLIELAFSYVEPRHRLQLATPQFQQRILRARESFRRHLPQSYADHIEFYQPDLYMKSGTLRDNLLFGRVAVDAPDAISRVTEVAAGVLREMSLDLDVNRVGLAYAIGPSGRLLQPEQRASLALARALMPQSAMVVLDGAFSPFSASEAEHILAGVREEMRGRTLVVTLSDPGQAAGFDSALTFDGARLAEARIASYADVEPEPEEAAAPATPGRAMTVAKEDRHAVK
jgi:putative ABC transport system ATP-binding protein